MSNKNTLERVIFEYSGDKKEVLEGEELLKWMKFNSIVASFAESHNINPPWNEIKWRKVGKDPNY